MSEHDDMDDLKRLLADNPPPAPDPSARARAAAAARAAFEAEGVAAADASARAEEEKIAANVQGSPDGTRQRHRQSGLMTLIGRRLMNYRLPSTKQLMMGGASIAVIAIAVLAVQNQDTTVGIPADGDKLGRQEAPEPAKRPEAVSAAGEAERRPLVVTGDLMDRSESTEPTAPEAPQAPAVTDGTLVTTPGADDEAYRENAPAPVVAEEATATGEAAAGAGASVERRAGRIAGYTNDKGIPAGDMTLADRSDADAPAESAELDSRAEGMRSLSEDERARAQSILGKQETRKLAIGAAPAKPAAEAEPIAEPVPVTGYEETGRDKFPDVEEAQVKVVAEEPVSTFSVDVDTASYSFMRSSILQNGVLPAKDSIRLEELINYFPYDYKAPESRETPFTANVAVVDTPWNEGTKLMRIGIKGYEISEIEKPKSNLVFLIDTSGSMNAPDKLPLLTRSFEMLLSTLNGDDTVSIVAYAGSAGVVLEPTKASEKATIRAALNRLGAGGSTAGGEGIRRAYELAEANRIEDGINRVILATDGDFNVGMQDTEELKGFIERKRDTGVFLSVLGFGRGNYNDALMQVLAQNGNGVAAYIDSLSEAQKVLVDEATSSLFPIAKDVKIQVEFNPEVVAEYRLIGYETRALNREDFNNDKVDAAEIGAGHTVTALYEITPVGSDARLVEPSRYDRAPAADATPGHMDEYGFVKIRYKQPDADTSELITRPVTKADEVEPDDDARFAAAVAAFGQMLKGGRYTGPFTFDDVIALANGAKGADPYGYRTEFVQIVRRAKTAAAMEQR